MLGPQSPVLFFVLLVVFGGLVFVLARARRAVWRTLAGTAAFLPPMVFGVAVVNKYYDYYASWGDVWQDLSDSSPGGAVSVADITVPGAVDRMLAQAAKRRGTAKTGFLFSTVLPGGKSGLDRIGLIYLPPQYFQPRFAKLRFPAMELLHGGPGAPSDYTRVMKITDVYRDILAAGKGRPAVLVMPDSNGGRDVSLQCLDTVGGPQDETYLVADIPDVISARLRVQPPGPAWGIAGYSEGGYCVANLALRHPDRYGIAGVLSGYFEPLPFSKLPRRADPFAGNRRLRDANTPTLRLLSLHEGVKLPKFWVMAGSGSKRDMAGAENFVALLRRFQPNTTSIVIDGGHHDYQAWRKAQPTLLEWATSQLPAPGI